VIVAKAEGSNEFGQHIAQYRHFPKQRMNVFIN
jgi:hypothetical protein